jgi:hypothetical protein
MSIKKSLVAGVAGALMAGSAMAAEPAVLTDGEMDRVSAGLTLLAGAGLSVLTGGVGFDQTRIEQINAFAVNEQSCINCGTAGTTFLTTTSGAVGVPLFSGVGESTGLAGTLFNGGFVIDLNIP